MSTVTSFCYAALGAIKAGGSPDEVTTQLRLTPTEISVAGDIVDKKKKYLGSHGLSFWYWSTRFACKGHNLNDHLSFLVKKIQITDLTALQQRGWQTYIDCHLFLDKDTDFFGDQIDLKTLIAMGQLNSELRLSCMSQNTEFFKHHLVNPRFTPE